MSNPADIRWMQRFSNFKKALSRLRDAVDLSKERELTDLESEGLIKAFEFTFELAWTTVKDFYESQGEQSIQGSRDAFRLAHERGLISKGESWMAMIRSRILTVHTYNEETADEIASAVVNEYYPLFVQMEKNLGELQTDPQDDPFKPSE